MGNLNRFEQMVPFRDDFFFPIEQEFNKFFNEMFGDKSLLNSVKGNSGFPKMDVYTENGKFVVQASVAVKPEDVKVEISPDKVLTISGKQEESVTKNDRHYFVKELRKSAFKREMALPDYLEGDPVAEIQNGTLTLTWELPKQVQEKPKSKSIEVKVK